MAEEKDDSQKTEEPTQKRLKDAEKEGQVASSRDVGNWFGLMTLAGLVGVLTPSLAEDLVRLLSTFIASPHVYSLEISNVAPFVGEVLLGVGIILALPVALILAAAFLGGLVQHPPVLAIELIEPKAERVSPLAGLKRMFSARSLVEFAKGIAKIVAVGVAAAAAVLPVLSDLDTFPMLEMGAFLARMHESAMRILFASAAVMAAIAGLDFLYQRHEHRRQLRMSHQDLKEEFKETEGDPHIKGRIRQIRTERAKKRMMQAVPKADVVIMNPTHFAVALSYKPPAMAAPQLVAKGVDSLALRIRAIAEEHGVPVVENPPLARALHGAVDVDEEIPSEHYLAVAEVIGYVMRLKGATRPRH
jgi:flagellar biosynthetic protein FlhB